MNESGVNPKIAGCDSFAWAGAGLTKAAGHEVIAAAAADSSARLDSPSEGGAKAAVLASRRR